MGGNHYTPPSRADNWLVDTGDHDAQSGGLSDDFGKVGGRASTSVSLACKTERPGLSM